MAVRVISPISTWLLWALVGGVYLEGAVIRGMGIYWSRSIYVHVERSILFANHKANGVVTNIGLSR